MQLFSPAKNIQIEIVLIMNSLSERNLQTKVNIYLDYLIRTANFRKIYRGGGYMLVIDFYFISLKV